jgi:hypothetical protein
MVDLTVFGMAAGVGFGLTMIAWFVVWGVSKAVSIFRHITKV